MTEARTAARRWVATPESADPDRCALVLPGAGYPVQMPGLHFPMRALALAGWTVFHAEWDLAGLRGEAVRDAVLDAAAQLDALTCAATHRLVVAKSVGTLAATWAADRGVPAAWITPLLTDERCAAGIGRSAATALLAAGARDHAWDEEAAQGTGKRVVRLGDADHGLGARDWHEELALLGTLTAAVEELACTVTG